MKYVFEEEIFEGSKEIRLIVEEGILRPIQLRRGSPEIAVSVRILETGAGPYVGITPNELKKLHDEYDGLHKRIVSLMFLKDHSIGISNLIKYDQNISATKLGHYNYTVISLFDPNSIERIRGMVDKSLRTLITGLNKPKRKYEPSATRRGRRTRVGRSVGRFSSL